MRKLAMAIVAGTLALATIGAPAFAANGAKPGSSTITDIVVGSSSFDVLEAAVVEAGLAGALASPDAQYTVFAPTDAAFVSTFRGLLGDNSLTESEVITIIQDGGVDATFGPGALQNILLFHVTNGRRISKSVVAAPGYQMLNGQRLTRAQLLDAGINTVDQSASNGVIHIIDGVLLPEL